MEQSTPTPCPKCQSNRVPVLINANVHAANGNIFAIQPHKHGALLGNNKTDLVAMTCTTCGYTELYARDPQKLIPDK